MQRTVKGTEIVAVRNNNGQPEIVKIIMGKRFTDRKALEKAVFKAYGSVAILEAKDFEKLYKIPDEIFFKYAVCVEDDEESDDCYEAEEV